MSFLDRLRGVRQEASARLWPTTAYKNTPPSFVSDFITEGAWNRDNMQHRGKMSRRNACAYNMTAGLANNTWDDGFKFVSKDDPEQEIMQEVLKELERMEHLKYMALAHAGELTYGQTFLFVGKEDDEDLRVGEIQPKNGPRVANFDVFTPETYEITKWDDIGKPLEFDVLVHTNAGDNTKEYQKFPIKTEDCISFRRGQFDRSYKGTPITYPCWNALVGLELLFHSVTTYAMKVGLGALILTTKGAISSDDLASAKDAMEDLSVSRVGVVPGRAVEKLEYIGASGSSVNFDVYIDAFLDQIAAGSKIPRDVLTGSSAGAITGSEVNSRALYAVIQGEQTRQEPRIREVVRRMGYESDDYDIMWNVRYATDEKQQAEIRALNAQAEMLEAQAKFASEPINVSMKDEDKNNNPAGTQ